MYKLYYNNNLYICKLIIYWYIIIAITIVFYFVFIFILF